MATQSLASQAGALSEFQLPALFSAPQQPIQARVASPYVTFAHGKRADEWKKLVAKFGTVNEGDMFLFHPDGIEKLDVLKCGWLAHQQYWIHKNAKGDLVASSFKEAPDPFKEHVEAVLLVYLDDRIMPANICFRTTKCGAAKEMSDALADASTPSWADRSPAHRETLSVNQPFGRFYGEIAPGATRIGKSSGLPYTPLTCDVKPTGVSEWRLLEAFIKDPETNGKLQAAAAQFQRRVNDVRAKEVK